jgi:hypothetical protein
LVGTFSRDAVGLLPAKGESMDKALPRIRRSAVTVLVAGGVALVAPSVASAAAHCGMNVTHSITLHADLNCPSGDGLNVEKSGITVNLNGHTITGANQNYVGVYNYHHSNVTVENGKIVNFEYGVLDEYGGNSRIVNVTAKHDYYGLSLWYSLNGLIDRSKAVNAEYALYLYQNSNGNISKSKAANSYYGVYDYQSHATLNEVNATDNYYGFYIDYPVATGGSKKQPYMIENSTANSNEEGFYIYDNYGPAFSADFVGDTAKNNPAYGFYAEYRAKGSHNHAKNNGTNCYHVPCN